MYGYGSGWDMKGEDEILEDTRECIGFRLDLLAYLRLK